jgi:ubiquinone/menaquinone biosynthesis C-methylase UbiE
MSSQTEYWNDAGGISWVVGQEQLDLQLEPFGVLAMNAAAVQPGEVVLDVGCGCGATSLELAARVGASGRVVGLDLSAPMLERARERGAGLPIDFLLGDAATHPLALGSFDVLFSRFGVMFFDEPSRAFAHLRSALKQDGRVAMVVWQSIAANPWVSVPIAAVADVVEPPALGAVGEPGPFSLADPEHLAELMRDAGYADVELEGHDMEMTVGGGLPLEASVEFTVEHGPLRRVLASATPEVRAAAADRVADELSRYDGPSGVRMPAAVWIITARRAGDSRGSL